MSDTTFVTMYAPALGNVQVDAPLQAVATYQSHGWLLLDPGATPPPVASPYLTQPAGDSRYLRDWAGAEVLTGGAVRVAPDGHVIVRVADGTTRSSYDGTEAALWTALGGANDPALRAAYGLAVAATVTATGALVPGKHNPVDATSGALTMTLPTGAAEGASIGVEKLDSSANAVTVTGNIRGASGQSIGLPWAHETLVLRADSSGSWWPVSGHKTKATLDAAYGPVRPSATDAGGVRDLVRAGAITASRPLVPSGDSHTDSTTSAHYMWDRLTSLRNQPGEGLENVASAAIVPLGYNGVQLSAWLADPTTLPALVAQNPSLVLACWLTNDVRLGGLGLTTTAIRAAGSALLLQLIDRVRAALPSTVIVLRVSAPYLTVDVGGSHYITDGTTVNPAGLAQIYTDGVRFANYDAAKARPGVLVYDPQTRLFGTTSPTAVGTNYANQIHQTQKGYEAEADDFAAWVAGAKPYNAALSIDAQASAPTTPWTAYWRDVEDPTRYVLLGEYSLITANPTTFVDLAPLSGPPVPNNLAAFDLLEFLGGQTTYQIPSAGGSFLVSGGNVRLTGLSLSVTAAQFTKVRAYRRIQDSDSAVSTQLLDTSWRFKRTATVFGGGTTFMDIGATSAGPQKATQPANEWVALLTAGDKVYVEGQGSSPLTIGTNATPTVSGTGIRFTGLTGVDWSAYIGRQVVIVGTHPDQGVVGASSQASQSGAVTLDLSKGNVIVANLTGNVTSWIFSNPSGSGQDIEVHFVQDATGSRTLAGADSSIKLAGGALTLTTTASKRDVVRFRQIGGTYYEVARSLNV